MKFVKSAIVWASVLFLGLVLVFIPEMRWNVTNIAYATDTNPPGAISDLGTVQTSSTSITVSWTAPGNDGYTGTATSYDIRYSTVGLITETTWSTASQATGEPAPQVAGS